MFAITGFALGALLGVQLFGAENWGGVLVTAFIASWLAAVTYKLIVGAALVALAGVVLIVALDRSDDTGASAPETVAPAASNASFEAAESYQRVELAPGPFEPLPPVTGPIIMSPPAPWPASTDTVVLNPGPAE